MSIATNEQIGAWERTEDRVLMPGALHECIAALREERKEHDHLKLTIEEKTRALAAALEAQEKRWSAMRAEVEWFKGSKHDAMAAVLLDKMAELEQRGEEKRSDRDSG